MRELIPKRPLAKAFVKIALIGVLVVTAPSAPHAQDRSSFVRLFRLDGTFSEALPAKIRSDDKSKNPGFALIVARLEADNIGSLTRLRTILTIANEDTTRRINEAEWRLDIYDASLRSVSARVLQADKVKIYAGETAVVSAKFGAVLPDRMIVLLQLIRVSFADGSAWSSSEECSFEGDVGTVSCKSK